MRKRRQEKGDCLISRTRISLSLASGRTTFAAALTSKPDNFYFLSGELRFFWRDRFGEGTGLNDRRASFVERSIMQARIAKVASSLFIPRLPKELTSLRASRISRISRISII
jgi:hypothetical protein